MKRKYSTKRIQELAASYALGAIGKRETQEFERLSKQGAQVFEADLQGFRQVTSMLGYGTSPITPPPSLKERLFNRVKGEAQPSHKLTQYSGFSIVRSNEGKWEEISKGVSLKRLFVDEERGYATALVRMLPGVAFPKHRHVETEECYVLEGDIHMGGQLFREGDYVRAEEGSIHEGIYSEQGCTLLILSSQSNEILE
ncbi:MAG: cupin domain-containing protein [Thermodesulfobacteriota bacterium]